MTKPLHSSGFLIIQVLVFGAVGLIILGAIIGWGGTNHRAATAFGQKEQAFQIAEAGIEYYRWHLAHAPEDFQDGQAAPGPYVHDYFDQNGNLLGQFTLTITPPPVGSTVVTVVSEGEVAADPTVSRSIEAILAIPSLAKFAVAANAPMRFGEGTEVFGPIHSNNGIRFDGLAHNLVTSAKTDYDDPDHTGANEFGVHTHVNVPPATGINDEFRAAEAPPLTAPPSRSDVFITGRALGVPAIDFDGFATDLGDIEDLTETSPAIANTVCRNGATGVYCGSSGVAGYLLVLKTNDTFDLFKVSSQLAAPSGCDPSGSQTGWGTWSVGATTAYLSNQPFPANGLLFFKDNVWVKGAIDGARLTVAAARDWPNADAQISVTDNLTYTHYDGSEVLGLIAQGNLNVGLASADDLRLDAALVSKNGRVGRYYYESPGCAPYDSRHQITLYGMIATNQRYGFAYTDGTGYAIRNINYDGHLLYGPPPSFPLTADHYEVISWREL